MDERNVEAVETVECTLCGKAHLECSEALLDGMAVGALSDAKARLSAEGVETLMMVGQASETLPGGVFEAWGLAEAENINRLPENDVEVLKIYFARITLIGHAREELYDDIFDQD
jgi:hypothetical protein